MSQSRQECYSGRKETGVYFAWDRIQLLVPSRVGGSEADGGGVGGGGKVGSVPGLICPAADSKKSEIVRQCEEWMTKGEPGSLGGRGVSAKHDEAVISWLESAVGKPVQYAPWLLASVLCRVFS